jgi:hypothetical protein
MALAGNPGARSSVERVMKRAVACVLVTVALPSLGVVVDATPAQACSCLRFTDAEAFASADAVFVGRLIGYEPPLQPASSVEPALRTFKVRRVYKGTVSRAQEVVSEVSGASCGLELPRRGVFLVFATTRTHPSSPSPSPAAGQLYAGLCGGTRALSDGVLEPGLARPRPPERSSSKPR